MFFCDFGDPDGDDEGGEEPDAVGNFLRGGGATGGDLGDGAEIDEENDPR